MLVVELQRLGGESLKRVRQLLLGVVQEGQLLRGLAALGLKLVDLAQLTRLAVTGRTASPPLFEVLALLGREETLARLRAVRAVIEARR